MKQRISILGSGWLGLSLAHHFQQHEHPIRLSTRTPQKQADLSSAGWNMYLVDIDTLDDSIRDFLDADILIINITNKSLDAFRLLRQHLEASQVKRVLFISSSSVYANLNRIVTEDEQAEDPSSPLYQIEQLLSQSSHFETTVLRLSGLIGPQRHPGRFFTDGKTVQQADAPVNLIHLDDCIGVIDAIIHQQQWGQVFNGCADTHPTKREFYSHARQQLSRPLPNFAVTIETKFKIVSNEKVKRQLSYHFKHPDVMRISMKNYE